MTHKYSIGTARYETLPQEAILVGKAFTWLLERQNADGTWGGEDSLDKFISTIHCSMAGLALGMSPDSARLAPAIEHLSKVDEDKNVSFFWRSGVLLNLSKYRPLVVEDARYIWRYRNRVGVHKDYPVPFFLLKLLRFGRLEEEVGFTIEDVLKRIFEDWDPDKGWYDRTSITTMSLALIHDLEFANKANVINRSVEYVLSKFHPMGADSGRFSENIVDDAFLVFNLCESTFLETSSGARLAPYVDKVVNRIRAASVEGAYWISDPPFGGSIGDRIYPTAVMIRALLSFFVRKTDFINQVSAHLVNAYATPRTESPCVEIKPFWGELAEAEDDGLCFVLMPFSPPKLTDIYERYVKRSVEAVGLRCIRADDIYRPGQVMKDVWDHINKAAIVIAELTDKNPNVFYELGMAHVLGKEVILITQSKADIPFDLRGVRQIIYEDRVSDYERLGRDIQKYVRAILEQRTAASGLR